MNPSASPLCARVVAACAAVVLAGLLGAAPLRAATLQPTDDPATSVVWLKVRTSLFGERPIAPAPAGMLALEAPARAIDAAVVPIAIRTRVAEPGRWVRRLHLIIDANPSPISAIFQFTPASGIADVEARVRVDDYSFVRAIAELDDGRLYAVHRFVKASGGCSAPAGNDPKAALATMGRMNFRVDGDTTGPAPLRVQLAIQHPNHSGLAMDQATRQFTPAHYVRKVEVTYAGEPVFSADVDFSMSENPNFRFHMLPRPGGAMLRAVVVDSTEREFVHEAGASVAAR